jgi:hypothetical protein
MLNTLIDDSDPDVSDLTICFVWHDADSLHFRPRCLNSNTCCRPPRPSGETGSLNGCRSVALRHYHNHVSRTGCQVTGLVHDLGKLLLMFGSEGQWDVVGVSRKSLYLDRHHFDAFYSSFILSVVLLSLAIRTRSSSAASSPIKLSSTRHLPEIQIRKIAFTAPSAVSICHTVVSITSFCLGVTTR